MTLEDFFTLSEMRDGLSSLARVEELLTMIQKLNDCATSNLSDAVRQWSTVASVITATDHNECLNQFIELNGLSFLNKWLKEALNITAGDGAVLAEGLIHSILTSFDRLPIDYKRITVSGVGATIELLLNHKSIPIKEKAKDLYEKWNHARTDVCFHDQDKSGARQSDEPGPSEDMQTSENCTNVANTVVGAPPCSVGIDEGISEVESAGTALQVSSVGRCSESSPLELTNKESVPTPHQALSTPLNSIDPNAVVTNVNSSVPSLVSNLSEENLPVTEESVEEKPLMGTSSQFCQERNEDDRRDASVSKDVPNAKQIEMEREEVKLSTSSQREIGNNSSSFPISASMTALVADGEATISCKLDSENGDSSASRATQQQPVAGVVDYESEKCLTTVKESIETVNHTSGFDGLSCTANILSNTGDPQLSGQKDEAMHTVIKDIDHEVKLKKHKSHFSTSTDFLKVVKAKPTEEISQKSEMRLECLDDALEVARQVAIAVEKEVVDYREPFCSSPEFNSGETTGSHSPNSDEENQDQPMPEEAGGNSSSGNDHSDNSSHDKESEITENISSDPENSDQDAESPKPKLAGKESVGKSIDGCTFDLNADFCSDEPESSMKPVLKMPLNVSAPVAVIASSKGAQGLPGTLHFGGEMGWKGSAATSAFRPASPRRTPDGERTSSGPKQKSIFLEFDLNLAERVDEVDDEPISEKQFPASSSLPSGDSCVEVSSKSEKLALDLNRIGEEDGSTYPFSSWKLHFQNGERSLSSASSSSYRQPSLRDFDLNDNPSFSEIGGSQYLGNSSSKVFDSRGGSTSHEPVIKIMGSKISVDRKDNNINQIPHFFVPNGLSMEPAMVARPLLPCTNMPTPAYGYTGLPAGPTMSVPPSYYSPGGISYMADTRGPTVVPHGPSPRLPFLVGASNMHYMAGFGAPRPSFDLNNGMASAEGGIREGGSGSVEHLFFQGHRGWMEEHAKNATQPSSSAVTLKRKEPDSGWESSLYGFKKMTSRQ
ncbi:hypothetical protein Cni_G27919 [Canna indica]|uniref:TFIIS N-terminal domain-containing protein n=1 Tax=Canna indica TaxID=4628 RepID=A0AAQ3L1M8_9LILI|nr:hypothetical protein Cni_G27919 [Canna indica]